MTTSSVPDREADPAGYLLAAADLREARARGIPEPRWVARGNWIASWTDRCTCGSSGEIAALYGHEPGCGLEQVLQTSGPDEADHIAAEANPAHALAEVKLWRGIVERHGLGRTWCLWCGEGDSIEVPCPDLRAAVAAARAYLDGAGQ